MFVLKVCVTLLALCAALTAAARRDARRPERRPERRPAPRPVLLDECGSQVAFPPTWALPARIHLCLYGPAVDCVAEVNDDGHDGPISLPSQFIYYGRKYSRLYVSTHD